jgi:hypothetical protein
MSSLPTTNPSLFKKILERCTDMSHGLTAKHLSFYSKESEPDSRNYSGRYNPNNSYSSKPNISRGNVTVTTSSGTSSVAVHGLQSRAGPNISGFFKS